MTRAAEEHTLYYLVRRDTNERFIVKEGEGRDAPRRPFVGTLEAAQHRVSFIRHGEDFVPIPIDEYHERYDKITEPGLAKLSRRLEALEGAKP